MATQACPWNIPASTAPATATVSTVTDGSSSSPSAQKTMQDIMDEALALKLYEEECRALEREINAAVYNSSNAFAHMQIRDEEASQRLGAHSFADFEDYEEYYEDVEDEQKPPLPAQPAVAAAAAAAALRSLDSISSHTSAARVPGTTQALSKASVPVKPFPGMKKQQYDRSLQVEDAGKGFNSIRESIRRHEKLEKNGLAGRVEAERHATRNGVLDERTERILQKMINRAELDAVHGCVQAGKEAHVYYAVGTDEATMRERALAVKVFKTTLNEFSNRHEYVTGDRRFDLHFAKKSMRRQLQTWTEKEFRNLCRAVKHVRAPRPLLFKEHVLVMDFVGDDGYPAPTLKDATLTDAQRAHAYADILQAVRTLYQDAHLVHADLSEYNILVHKRQCWLIDFGQATDRTHPDFDMYLTRDLHNVLQFFRRAGLPPASADEVGWLSPEDAFAFVTTESPLDVLAPFAPLRELLNEKYQQQQRHVS